MDETAEPLNPRQQYVWDEMFDAGGERPTFPAELSTDIRELLNSKLADIAANYTASDALWISKSPLGSVLRCEGLFAVQEFAWRANIARGTVAHKALEIHGTIKDDNPIRNIPRELVDRAITYMIDEDDPRGIASYLISADEIELAKLRSEAVNAVGAFFEAFPPVKSTWKPRWERSIKASLCSNRIVLSGKIDLALGTSTARRAGAMFIDFKTGRITPDHRYDLRFYALLQLLFSGVPPFRCVTFDLESGEFEVEAIDADVLHAAALRTAEGVERIHAIKNQLREPVLTTGGHCNYCPDRPNCSAAAEEFAD